MDMRALCRVGSRKPVASKVGKYNFNLVTVQEVRGIKGGSQQADGYTFFCRNGNADCHLGTGFSYIRESYQ
jgi:hypothetical protein